MIKTATLGELFEVEENNQIAETSNFPPAGYVDLEVSHPSQLPAA